MLETFMDLASKKEQEDYKNEVPFVHIPHELISQWFGNYIIDRSWYREIWTENQLELLKRFDKEFTLLIEKLPNLVPDVPEIFENDIWQQIMKLSKDTLIDLKESS